MPLEHILRLKNLLSPKKMRTFAPALSKANPCDGELRQY